MRAYPLESRCGRDFTRWPDPPVVLSLIGDVPVNPGDLVVYGDPGTDYDWRPLIGLSVVIAIGDDTDATRAIDGICAVNDYEWAHLWHVTAGQYITIYSRRPLMAVVSKA